ncbi:thioesterase family protein [Streptomyces gobiensis]|uniref:thioesterase family protein n=1 Tax=Streptomyces gobiensis TaxID=2875706 RepID=UPI001E492FF5|nr:thioesterase family protein [Streptomyces gobiensis]UGY92956.1 thioesterase family protein [Streptomyces gobiensis]
MNDRLPDFEQTVRPEWVDYNGCMSEAFYVLVFGHATDMMRAETGLGSGYREGTGCSLYTGETHVRYLSEVEEGAELTIRTRVLGVSEKEVRFTHEMYVGTPDDDAAEPVATSELLGIHVDQRAGRSAPLPDAIRECFAALTETPPAWAGGAIGPVPSAA